MARDADPEGRPRTHDDTGTRRTLERRRLQRIPKGLIAALVATVAVAIALVAILVDGNGDAVDRAAPPGGLPEWLQEVTPPPGARLNGAIAVSVDPDLLASDREVRLVVDGTDVTSQAGVEPQYRERAGPIDPGPIVYDPQDTAEPLVELLPGRHEAEARLVEYPSGVLEGESVEVESFSWAFEIF